jgi:hypothetical protein
MRREVLVADAKPCRLANEGEGFQDMEGIAFQSVAGFVVEDTRQPVDDRVDVG